MLDGDAGGGVREVGGFVMGHQPLHVFEVLAASFAGRGDDLSAGLAAQPLVAGIGENPQVDGVGEEVDDAGLAGLGDVRAASGSGLAAEQQAVGRRTRISVASMIAVWPVALMWAITSARVRRRTAPSTVQPRSASSGRTSPMARVMVERLDAELAGQHVVGDTVPHVREGGQQTVDEDQLVPGSGTDGPPVRPVGQSRLVTGLPDRANFRNQSGDHLMREPRDPPVRDDRLTSTNPHHALINDQPPRWPR